MKARATAKTSTGTGTNQIIGRQPHGATFSKVLDGRKQPVRTHARMPGFHFHDCRHNFISMAVISGVDFMTIAAWGGVLIGKVYGHLANEHRKAMAERVTFGPKCVLRVCLGGIKFLP